MEEEVGGGGGGDGGCFASFVFPPVFFNVVAAKFTSSALVPTCEEGAFTFFFSAAIEFSLMAARWRRGGE